MPSTIKCPHCQATLETDLRVGQALRCPGCKKGFRIERSMLASDTKASSNYKFLVPRICCFRTGAAGAHGRGRFHIPQTEAG